MSFTVHFHRLAGPPAYGADGLVRGIAAACEADLDELRVLSGVAFRAYQLTPDDNHAYREVISEREWSWGSVSMENYGVVESLGVHLRRDFRFWRTPRPVDLLAVLKHELSAGRGALGCIAGEEREWVWIHDLDGRQGLLEAPPLPHAGTGSAPATNASGTLEIASLESFDDDAPVLLDVVLTVRPGVDEIPESRARALRDDVLRFAGRHATSRRELNFQEELFYASGLRAYAVSAELLTDRWVAAESAAFRVFWRTWLRDLREGRRSAARVFGAWSANGRPLGARRRRLRRAGRGDPSASDSAARGCRSRRRVDPRRPGESPARRCVGRRDRPGRAGVGDPERSLVMRRLLALVLLAPLACASQRSGGEPQHLHVIVDRLPQCEYGVGYEQPLRIDLVHDGEVLATSFHSGMYTGEDSLRVPLHVPEAHAGRYRIRFGRCPSLVTDPTAAVACESPDWFKTLRTRLQPSGITEPQVVEYYRVRARCMDLPEPAERPVDASDSDISETPNPSPAEET